MSGKGEDALYNDGKSKVGDENLFEDILHNEIEENAEGESKEDKFFSLEEYCDYTFAVGINELTPGELKKLTVGYNEYILKIVSESAQTNTNDDRVKNSIEAIRKVINSFDLTDLLPEGAENEELTKIKEDMNNYDEQLLENLDGLQEVFKRYHDEMVRLREQTKQKTKEEEEKMKAEDKKDEKKTTKEESGFASTAKTVGYVAGAAILAYAAFKAYSALSGDDDIVEDITIFDTTDEV